MHIQVLCLVFLLDGIASLSDDIRFVEPVVAVRVVRGDGGLCVLAVTWESTTPTFLSICLRCCWRVGFLDSL